MYWGAIFVTALSEISLIVFAPISERIKEKSKEQFKAQKRYQKIKHESDDVKMKRLEALRLWLELNHEHEHDHDDEIIAED